MANFSININKKTSNVIIGEDVTKGDLLYLSFNNKWYKTTAGNKTKSTTELMMALSDGLKDEQIELLNYGYFQFDNPILISGDKYYVSINSGKITNQVYDTNDHDYVIRYVGTAFTDKILLFNPDQTYISDNRTKINEVSIGANGGGSFVFQNDIVVALSDNKTFGKYLNGDIMPLTGMTFEEVIRDIAIETINPTFVNPKLTLSNDVSGVKEVGESLTIKLTATFNRGQIKGKIVNGVWNENTEQNKRAGEATKYLFDGISNGLNNQKTITNYTTKLNANTFSAVVEYGPGPQPTDSAGNDYSSPLPSGSISSTTSYTGAYRRFFGNSSNNNIDNSADVRALPQTLLDNADLTFILHTGNVNKSFYIVIPSSRTLVDVFNLNTNAKVTNEFEESTIQVEDAGGTLRDYRMYRMTNASSFSANQEFEVEIK